MWQVTVFWGFEKWREKQFLNDVVSPVSIGQFVEFETDTDKARLEKEDDDDAEEEFDFSAGTYESVGVRV
jgi:uncharacterized Rmd1/YagE family protein